MRERFEKVRLTSGQGPIHAERLTLFPMRGTSIARSRMAAGLGGRRQWIVWTRACVIFIALAFFFLAIPLNPALAQGKPTTPEADLKLPDEVIDTSPPAVKGAPNKRVKTCPKCKKEADTLQALLDAYFTDVLTNHVRGDPGDKLPGNEAKQFRDDWVGDSKQKAEKEKATRDNREKGGPDAPSKDLDKLKKQIDDAAKALKACLPKCNAPEEKGKGPTETTPPPSTTEPPPKKEEPPKKEAPPALPKPIALPDPPKCFETEQDRKDFVSKWEAVVSEQQDLARRSRANALAKSEDKKDPWYVYYNDSAAIYQKVVDALRKIIDDADNENQDSPLPAKGQKGEHGAKAADRAVLRVAHPFRADRLEEEHPFRYSHVHHAGGPAGP